MCISVLVTMAMFHQVHHPTVSYSRCKIRSSLRTTMSAITKRVRTYKPTVTVITKDSSEFRCHGFQLCHMSPVFDALCNMPLKMAENTIDNDTATITLKDLDAYQLSLLHQFIAQPFDPSLHAKIHHEKMRLFS